MAKKRAVVITFGRFQPPTIGHEKLINAVIAHAQKMGAEHRIYASQSFDGNRPKAAIKNPLQYSDKIKFMRKMFPKANIVMGDNDTNTFMRVLYQLQKEKYTTVHIVVGDDRVPEITKTVKQYLGSDDPETGLNFEDFKVVSAGKRDPEAEGVEGMSASKLRAAAAENDFKLFKKGMPSGFSGARELFDAIRKGLERPMKPEKKSNKAKVNEELLNEVTPPDEKSERLVKKAKASFKDRYGDDWASYLYGVAWKQYNKRHGIRTKTRLGEPISEAYFSKAKDEPQFIPSKYDYNDFFKILKNKKLPFDQNQAETSLEYVFALSFNPKSQYHKFVKDTGQLMSEAERHYKKAMGIGLAEGVDALNEGGMKGALEDWLYDLPKKVIAEIKNKFGKKLKAADMGGSIVIDDPTREKIRQILVRNRVKPLLGDKNHAEGTSAIIMSFHTFHGDLDEATINEGAVKASIEDWIESLPKNVVAELKKKFGKELKAYNEYGSSIRDQQTIKGIQAILVKNGVNPLFDGDKKHHQGASELLVSFHSFHGDLKESLELDEGTARYELSLPEIRHEYIERQGLDRISTVGTQTISVYPILKNGKKVGYLKYEDRYGSLSGELHGRKLFKEYEYPPRGDVYSWFSKFIKSSRGKKFVKESVELDEGSYVHSRAELKAAIKGSKEEIKSLTMKLKMLKKAGLSKESIKKAEDDIQFWQDNLADAEEQLKSMKESLDLDEATIPRDAQIVDRNKEEKTVTLKWNDEDGWHEEEVPEDEVPGFYDRAADPMKKRKTDRFGNIMKTPAKGAEKKTEKAMAANTKNAEEILDIFDRKPMKTPITIYGKKWGKRDEYEMVVLKRLYQGDEVFVVKSSGRFVELRPTSAGLQVIDVKTKKILLDKGNDATW